MDPAFIPFKWMPNRGMAGSSNVLHPNVWYDLHKWLHGCMTLSFLAVTGNPGHSTHLTTFGTVSVEQLSEAAVLLWFRLYFASSKCCWLCFIWLVNIYSLGFLCICSNISSFSKQNALSYYFCCRWKKVVTDALWIFFFQHVVWHFLDLIVYFQEEFF